MSRNALPPLSEHDYEAIEGAVMETSRGRWFLAEYARRNRSADTTMVLDAISRLERHVAGERTAQDIERVRYELVEMAEAISRTKSEIAVLKPAEGIQSRFEEATEALDSIVRTTERATSDILEAAEQIQEAAWTLREMDSADVKMCDELDRRATDIYTACSFQDITAQRTIKVVHVLRYLEGRINAMIDLWSQPGTSSDGRVPAPVEGPIIDSGGLTQDDVDIVICEEQADLGLDYAYAAGARSSLVDDDLVFVENKAADTAKTAAAGQARQVQPPADLSDAERRRIFAAVDGMTAAEKLRRFS
jgi:chemotaxis regulatin CheY-phosphate phosphatase CheZ